MTNRYNVAVSGSGTKTLVYDLKGNLTSDGTREFEWDPVNRDCSHEQHAPKRVHLQRAKPAGKDRGERQWCRDKHETVCLVPRRLAAV